MSASFYLHAPPARVWRALWRESLAVHVAGRSDDAPEMKAGEGRLKDVSANTN